MGRVQRCTAGLRMGSFGIGNGTKSLGPFNHGSLPKIRGPNKTNSRAFVFPDTQVRNGPSVCCNSRIVLLLRISSRPALYQISTQTPLKEPLFEDPKFYRNSYMGFECLPLPQRGCEQLPARACSQRRNPHAPYSCVYALGVFEGLGLLERGLGLIEGKFRADP